MAKFKNIDEAEAAFEQLEKEHADLVKTNKKLEADLKEKDGIIADIRSAKTKGGGKPSFTFQKETYEVGAKEASWNGKIITAEQICKDSKLQAELIEAGVGFITKIQK